MKWFISSLTKHDFLLAAMIVCLDLHYDSVTEALPERPANYDPYFWTPAQKKDMLETLETSQGIWKGSSDKSMEAFKASGILQVVLDKLNLTKAQAAEAPSTADVFAQFDDENLRPEHSAAMTLGMLSGGLTPNSAAMFNAMAQSPGGTRYNMDMNMGESSSGGTGMTPNYAMDTSNAFGLSSPFTGFGTGTGSGAGVMDVPANLDWVRLLCLSSRSLSIHHLQNIIRVDKKLTHNRKPGIHTSKTEAL